jgi:hypothetical protein
MSPRFFATSSEMLDIYLVTLVAVRPGQPAPPLRSLQRRVLRQHLRTPLKTRSAISWRWRNEFGHLAGRDRRN